MGDDPPLLGRSVTEVPDELLYGTIVGVEGVAGIEGDRLSYQGLAGVEGEKGRGRFVPQEYEVYPSTGRDQQRHHQDGDH